MAVRTCYISRGCNRVPHCLDWGKNNLICYGACHSVALYDPKFSHTGAVCQTLTGHTDRVNCVRWIKQSDNVAEFEFVSASSDKTAVVWRLQSGSQYTFKPACKLKGHTDVINAVHAVYRCDDTLIVTASSDCTIKVWHRQSENDEAVCIQTVNLGSHFALDLKLSYHPKMSTVPLLIFGGSDTKLNIYAERNNEFEETMSLTGHEDWIRAIDTTVENNGDLLIASCAQDCFIRLWRLTLTSDDIDCENDIKLRGNSFMLHDADGTAYSFNVGLEAIMAGHENWIYGLHWHPRLSDDQPLKLLSASMDKTMILWELDGDLGVWIEKVRVGEVGGNTLGFYGNRFSPDGQSILAHGFQGAFHLWHFEKESNKWESGVTVSGHFDEVLDLDWDSGGQFVISVSSDQTARLHAPWCKKDKQIVWYEMARPQVHGYDMTCITVIGRHKFASGADEKVLRAFQAPKNFLENFSRLCGGNPIETDPENKTLPEGASVPALGLSNKAVFEKTTQLDLEARHPKDIYPEAYFVSTTLSEPPTEETLLQNTLWPEIYKMYGHGYEIFCVASNKNGTLLASACKATKTEHAKIIVWSTSTWKEIAQLAGHSLTVTQMEFSPCGRYLLSVSRDRTWSLYELHLTKDEGFSASRVAYSDKKTSKHSRIIWCCAWSNDSKYFATGSRDKKLFVWSNTAQHEAHPSCLGNWCTVADPLVSNDSVTAVAFAPHMLENARYLVAVGLECGAINLYKWNLSTQDQNWHLCYHLDSVTYHHQTVKRLRFSPVLGCAGDDVKSSDVIQLASCGSDHAIYVFNIQWKLL